MSDEWPEALERGVAGAPLEGHDRSGDLAQELSRHDDHDITHGRVLGKSRPGVLQQRSTADHAERLGNAGT